MTRTVEEIEADIDAAKERDFVAKELQMAMRAVLA